MIEQQLPREKPGVNSSAFRVTPIYFLECFQSYTKFLGYITTQLPLADTIVDFWTMIRDHGSSTIVLLLNEPEEVCNQLCINIIQCIHKIQI